MMRARLSDLPISFEAACYAPAAAAIVAPVTLAICDGPPTVIIGPNGAGKTTLLKLAMGLVSPTQGRVTWGGRTSTDAHNRAFVLQRPVMLRRSVAGNVAFALEAAGKRANPAEVERLLAMVGLAGLARRPARRLSGGEQQRLAIARALARGAEVLFLDEPTASLDPAATKAIEEIIADAARAGTKVVMTTHDLGEARRLAGEILFMVAGRVVERAPAASFFTAPATEAARRFLAGDLVI